MTNTAPTGTLERFNPFLAIEDDHLVTVHGDYAVGFELTLPEIFTLSEEEYWEMHDCWVKAIRSLPPYTVVHKQDVYIKHPYVPNYQENPSYLSRSYQLHFAQRPYLQHHCYLYISKTCVRSSRKKTLWTTLCRNRLVPAEQLDENTRKEFDEAVNQFSAILSVGKISLRCLTEADYLGENGKNGLLENFISLYPEDGMSMSDLRLDGDRVVAGGKHCCVFTIGDVDDLPQQVSPCSRHDALSTDRTSCHLSFANPVGLNLGHNHIYNQYIFIDDPNPMLEELAKRARHMTSLSKLSRENTINAQYISDFIDLVHEEGMYPIRAHINIMAWGNEKEFDTIRNDISAALSVMDCRPRQATADAPVFFWSGIPCNGADFPSEDTFIQFAESAVCFFTSETAYRSSDSSFGIKLCDRFSLVPLHVDLSDEPMTRGLITNRNKFILGPSGSGKSFFINHLLRQYWEQGAHNVIVDIGNSYMGLCQWVAQRTGGKDGIYYTYTEENPITFNPFYTDDRKFDIEKQESIVILLLTLWKKEEEMIRRSEEVAVSDAVAAYTNLIARNFEIAPSFNNFYEWLQTEYADILAKKEVRETEFDLHNFLIVLRPYYKGGMYDYLLNADNNLDLLNKRFVVFELDNIKDHKILFPVVTIIIMETFINKMRKLKGIRKVILIEEAWKAITKSSMADFIKYLFKTVRKHFGEAMVVTQEADDILSSPIVKESIINNSDCKILLDQRKYMNKFDGIQAVLGLTDKQKAQVLSINQNLKPGKKYKEVYIDLGGQYSCVYATEVSPQEYLVYTTEQTEKMAVFDKADQYGGDIETAIKDITSKS